MLVLKFKAYNEKTGEILIHSDLNYLIECVELTNFMDGLDCILSDWTFSVELNTIGE